MLLDTHLLLRALGDPSRISPAGRPLIDASEVFVSASSLWEISIKAALGRLAANPREVLDALEPAGFLELPVTGEHAARVAELPALHRDPFDRLLVAQALTEPMRLLTTDRALAGYGEIVTVIRRFPVAGLASGPCRWYKTRLVFVGTAFGPTRPEDPVMSKVCQITGKKPMTGNTVSHANNKRRRRFLPNLHVQRFWLESEKRWVSLKVSGHGMRTIDKKGVETVVAELRAQGVKV